MGFALQVSSDNGRGCNKAFYGIIHLFLLQKADIFNRQPIDEGTVVPNNAIRNDFCLSFWSDKESTVFESDNNIPSPQYCSLKETLSSP